MNNKMVRFLSSLEIKDIDRFDLDFDLVSRNQFIREQIDMFIVKDTPWDYALLEEFQNGLAIIGYPYTIQFSYKIKPTVYDAIRLFDDWHRSHNRYQAEIHLDGKGDIITFVYNSEKQKEEYEQVVKDYKEFLEFLCYNFDFDEEIHEVIDSAPTVSQKKLEKIEAKAIKVLEEEENEEESETSYYKDREEVEEEQEELRQAEEEYIQNLKDNLEQMKKDQKKGKSTYKNWRDKIPYAIVKDLSLLDENSGNVDISGELFGIDKTRTLRNGKTFLTFGIGNPTGAINVKAMEGDYISAEQLESFKNGMFARIAGYVGLDKYSGKPVLDARAIDLLPPPELRKDEEEQKRVELHLHTKMSVMDGVSDIKKYCELAKNMGHTAIAITDHGVTQGFPDASDAAKATGIKMIYGSELYMVNDELPFALNPTDELLRSASYVVFDLETTGLSTRYDRITEFGGVRFEHGQVVETLDILINPECEIPAKIVEKTKITNEMVKNKPTIAQAIDRILEFMKDSILVSHNITFDYGFINENLKNLGREKLTLPAIDTLSLSHYLFPEASKHTLGALSRNLGITSYNEEEAHRADFDARILNEVWLAMLNRLTKENYDMKHSDLAKIKSTNAMLKHMRPSHVTCLAMNKDGFHDLNQLISESHIDFLADVPKTPKREIARLRKNLLLGSACLNGEVFDIERTRSKEDLLEAMKFYDFIEVQPPANYSVLINRGQCYNEEEIKKYIKDIVLCAEELGITCVATGDVHYANPEDKVIRDIYIEAPAVGGKPHPLNIRNKDCESPDQHYRSTKEMLDAFEFLGKEKAFEIVVTNTNKIADMFPDISPIQKTLHPPVIEGSPEILTNTCYENAKKLYGDPLPEEIQTRLQKELDGIIKNGYSVTYYIANQIVSRANQDGFMVGSRGSVGSSFAAHMFGITEVNPLRPHYRCPKCKHLEFVDSNQYLSGYDLPDKICPVCGEKMVGDGQNIPFETFLGFNAEKIPDIDLNFPSDYQARAFNLTKEIFGPNNVFRAGTIETVAEKTAFGYVRRYFEHKGLNPDEVNPALIAYYAAHAVDVKRTTGQHPGGIMVLPKGLSIYDFTPIQYPADDKESTWLTTHLAYTALHDALLKLDLLGHVDPLALKMMSEMTGIDVKKIPLNDQRVISLFTSDKALKRNGNYLGERTGAIGLPEFGTQTGMDILRDANPKSFADLVAIAGLAHGTDVWANNARDLIVKQGMTLRDVIGCRDDIMTYLINKDIPSNIAFAVMEDVRKGRKVKPEYEAVLRAKNVPDWYIDSCNKIKYMFPKAHAVAYVTMAVRVGYFKLYHPLEFYAVWFTARCKAYDIKAMLAGKDGIIARYNELKVKKTNKLEKLSPKETEIMKMLTIAIEMAERGYEFGNIDLYKSDALRFIVDKETNKIIPPFIVIDGLGDNAALSVVEARKEGPFSSKEDLLRRTKLNGTNVDDLSELGVLDGLGESDQMSLFEFGLDD